MLWIVHAVEANKQTKKATHTDSRNERGSHAVISILLATIKYIRIPNIVRLSDAQ